jgi:hypothetical protein
MNTNTISGFEGEFESCEFCEGRGYYPAPDGTCDFEMVVCSCEAGEQHERKIYQLMEDNRDLL